MKIAMLSYHTCPLATLGGKDTGGMNVYVRELTRHLGQLGVHVDVFTRSQDEHVPHVLHDLGYGNRVVHIAAGPETPLPKPELAAHLPAFAEGIQRFAAEKGIHYDLIHSHYWMSGMAAQALQAAWQAPIVHMFHTLVQMKNRVARRPEEKEGDYRLQGERQILQFANRIIAATPAEQAQLQFLYHANPRQITILPPGVDTGHFYPIPPDEAKAVIGIPAQDRMILFVGRIEPLKGIDTLLHAIACLDQHGLQSQYPHYLAIIGGDPATSAQEMNSEMARLQTLTGELGIRDLVLFLGKRSQDSLPYYYSAAEVLVMPSHYESFGMVALEAMACGTPVIASQVGGLAFLVQNGKTGFVIPDDDPAQLCEQLAHLLREPAMRQQMSQQSAAYAQSYAWPLIAQQMLELYQTVQQQT